MTRMPDKQVLINQLAINDCLDANIVRRVFEVKFLGKNSGRHLTSFRVRHSSYKVRSVSLVGLR